MLASELFGKNNVDRKVEHVELVFVIEMAHKTKKHPNKGPAWIN